MGHVLDLSSLNDKVIHPGAGQVKVTVTEPRNVKEALESIVRNLSTAAPLGGGLILRVSLGMNRVVRSARIITLKRFEGGYSELVFHKSTQEQYRWV